MPGWLNISSLLRVMQGILREVTAAGLEVNEHILRCLMFAYGKRGLGDRAGEVFDQILKLGIRPKIATWGALVNAFAESRKPHDAARVVRQMQACGEKVSQVWVYRAVGSLQPMQA